ncbi:hypothetical protein C9374_001676 [Naegleria lovaniensis]|uniref:Armadillo repeat-containing protein 8 n=1 Tax=Naegleria lovaniensis TaxID=51637 RepID=A0AA88GWE4_NAELO|nr:uncharacterized protein C9374_001676 [Naegleria lovaniensis]KAG2387344.1 hypothetical protein C9374_001676 [Naegleria lovaniensis]
MYPFKQPSELIQALCDGSNNDSNSGILNIGNVSGVTNNNMEDESIIKVTMKQYQPSSGYKVNALKSLKNLVIGNPKKKQLVAEMGVLPILVNILQNSKDEELLIQSAATIGSLAHCNELIFLIIQTEPTLNFLTRHLIHFNNTNKLTETVARSVYNIFSKDITSIISSNNLGFQNADFEITKNMPLLIELLSCPNHTVNEMAAAVIRFCFSSEQRAQHYSAFSEKILPQLFRLLYTNYSSHEIILDSICKILLFSKSKEVADFICNENSNLELLTGFCFHDKLEIKLSAIDCVALLQKLNSAAGKISHRDISTNIVPEFSKILNDIYDTSVLSVQSVKKVLLSMCLCMECDLEIQSDFVSAKFISKLINISQKMLADAGGDCKFGNITASLELILAIAMMCSSNEEARSQIIESSFFIKSILISCLDLEKNPQLSTSLVEAALSCTKVLSRAQKPLRSSLISSAGNLLSILCNYIVDSSNEINIRKLAIQTFHNLTLDLESVKDFVQNNQKLLETISDVCQQASISSPTIRMSMVTLARNILYRAELSLKKKFLEHFPVSKMVDLLSSNDSESNIEFKIGVLSCIRNLIFGETNAVEHEIMSSEVCQQLVLTLLDHLKSSSVLDPAFVSEIYFVFANIVATCRNEMKRYVLQKDILDMAFKVKQEHVTNEEVVKSTLFFLSNLVWERNDQAFQKECYQQLRAYVQGDKLVNDTTNESYAVQTLVQQVNSQYKQLEDRCK